MSNRLGNETSPYLRQHAGNPVDWWPWGDAALDAARVADKPILLSIGYSACHWCHVMAHESFEDPATAQVMNDLFICIKVDREERPDLDRIYQLAHQALTRHGGGWPLTVFLTPDDHLPFHAGTYFPREARYGMPPFVHVLHEVRRWWDERRDDVRAQNAALAEFLSAHGRDDTPAQHLSDAPLQLALSQSAQSFDPAHGGHRGAPKFPHCAEMELLLDLAERPVTGAVAGMSPREMVDFTLARMAAGGIHDQIGGGFCRYAVDERWEIPHFEKMLYDNAQLLPLYARRGTQPGSESFAEVARELIAWLVREMTSPEGAFYSALDADSEHAEGKFYVWQRDAVRNLLDDQEFAVAERRFGFKRPPNFEQTAWNPVIVESIEDTARALGITETLAVQRLRQARAKLFAARSRRVRPGLDDKVLTAWNALMICGIARAALALDAPPLMGLADAALDCLYRSAWRDGRLHAKADADATRFPAYLDDHAFLLDALLECLRNRWNGRDLAWAIVLAEALLARFEDAQRGGFFFTAHDHERLIQRPKSWTDDAVPAGNGVAARALLRLGHLLGEPRYLDAAERTLRAAFPTLQQMALACASLLRALNDFLHPRTHVVIRFRGDAEETAWRAALGPAPDRSDVYFIDADAVLCGTLASQKYAATGVAYVCRGTQCLAPITDPAQLRKAVFSAEA